MLVGVGVLVPAVPRLQTAALFAEGPNSYADVREYLFTGIKRKTELCCAAASDENVRYVQIYKSNTQGFCGMIKMTGSSSQSSLAYSRLKQLWDQDSHAKECRDAFTFTFVREPLDHFISGASEIAFRFQRNQRQTKWKHERCTMPPLSCYTWAAPSLNVTQRARAFIEDFAWGKLNSPCCTQTREVELHVMPQTAFVMDALDGRMGTPVPQIDVIGRLESIQEGWSHVAAAVRGLPAQYKDDERFHPGSDAESGNEFRTAIEALLQDDSAISSETRDAFCHQLRYDYACFGYAPDRVCAHASPGALEARCPLHATGGTYVPVEGYSSWYSNEKETAHAGDVGLRTAVIPIADYNGFDFELVAETKLDQDGVAPDLPGVFRTLQVFRAEADIAQAALIHVGKCAGWTVRDTLRNYGITVWEYHMRQPEPSDLQKRKTAITTRDPVDRAVSAFNWRHPSNPQIHNNPFGDRADPEEAKLYQCFDSVHAFAEALDSRNTSTCAQLARTMLSGPKSKRGRWSMLGDDMRWYLERVLPQLRRGEIDFTLTHVAQLDADVNYAVQWITTGDWTSPETQSVEMASVHDDDYPKKYDTDLSPSGRRLLRAALQPEYDLLEELEKLAVKVSMPAERRKVASRALVVPADGATADGRCPPGWSEITDDIDGHGRTWTNNTRIAECGNKCGQQSGCTAFAFSDNFGSCATYDRGSSNIQIGHPQDTQFISCTTPLQAMLLSFSFAAAQVGSAYGDNALVEVLHMVDSDDHLYGARWLYHAPGTGIWLDLGRTIAFDSHAEVNDHFGVACACHIYGAWDICAHVARRFHTHACPVVSPETVRAARAAGYDTIQILKHDLDVSHERAEKFELIDLQLPYVRRPPEGSILPRYYNSSGRTPCVVATSSVLVPFWAKLTSIETVLGCAGPS